MNNFRLNWLTTSCVQVLLTAIIIFAMNSCLNDGSGNKTGEKVVTGKSVSINESDKSVSDYNPMYWLEGLSEKELRDEDLTPALAKSIVEQASSKGWHGLLYWGADREGAKMKYYFRSPFLEKLSWAEFKRDGLSPLISAAHERGLKVMINIEGVNPYHWQQNQWNAENIRGVAGDLASEGVDAVFEECFEVKPEVFLALAGELKRHNVNYISGTDPMLLRESGFSSLWPETGTINIYNYYLKRDKIFNIATLAQHGSLGYGWAKYWNKPAALISPLNRNWGIAGDYSPAVVKYLCMIRALQFRLDNFIIFGGLDLFDPISTQSWIDKYVKLQEKERPLMNIVVLLDRQTDNSSGEGATSGWNRLFNSGDAITSGAMNAGYNIIVSDRVIPADAYWIYTKGGADEILPPEVVALFDTEKPVFIQSGGSIPSGPGIKTGWQAVLGKCGIDATKSFRYAGGKKDQDGQSLPPDQTVELPYTGYYNDVYLRFTGFDAQRGTDLREGTVIPANAIHGKVFCVPNKTYGRGPFITGRNNKYLVTASTLSWETAYPISNLLSGCGILPSSNVWGIVGKNVTALLAIETTELNMIIPGVKEGSRLHVVVWDSKGNRKSEETISYKIPFRHILHEYDFILIDKVE